MTLLHVQFEVFGKVQRVFFRKYTQAQADTLGLKGWCENTPQGTVQGEMQGPKDAVDKMKHWLRHEGSPKSKIERAVFSEPKEISDYTFSSFNVKR